jgi:predicted DNA-binding transcriptional regulator AlpA
MHVVTDMPSQGNTDSRLFYRYADLKNMGIVGSWPTLTRWVERGIFPPGIWLGPNTRAWPKAEIDAWLASRPQGGTR